jgi:S-adenosylmethionine:tRNA ribosyltransferase-isomerase
VAGAPADPPPYPTSAFDYHLPAERIARYPVARRDESRLLVLDRATGAVEHRVFRELPGLVPAGDAVVLNETRVIPARLLGRKPSGGEAEILLLTPRPDRGGEDRVWEALVRPGRRLRVGALVEVADGLRVAVLEELEDGRRLVELRSALPARQALQRFGSMPLPPYIERPAEALDRDRYQTVYARVDGSVAAPTAGLHFTPAVLARLEARGVRLVRVRLHVGAGTFRPVEAEDPAGHRMHAESYRVDEAAAAALNEVRAGGGALWAVGTTVARTLETVADADGRIRAGQGWTRLFIRPPYRFRAVDRLLTNFHLPRSTLLMLVAALGGYESVMAAYGEAVAAGYRFYSYGDAMLVR